MVSSTSLKCDDLTGLPFTFPRTIIREVVPQPYGGRTMLCPALLSCGAE
ncbi:hypothetical protein RchiOBHm_Chr2g0091871 [Rosa chinensis]|uniref:Uncharacterized protein n=1 Tax=Rosa chinensis TaxID=74649 RepID=A0A2P6RJU9_ROSCH|nr:hypothetical protein RchiOBHm_Chr2g0091871 [Rosa chinensis]